MRLLPKDIDNGWAPYVWLCYLVFFWIDPILSHAGWRVFTATALATAAFLVMYFTFYWILCEWQALLLLAGMLGIGVGFAPFNGGASTFFIFAACMLPFVIEKETHVLRYLAVVLAVAVSDMDLADPAREARERLWLDPLQPQVRDVDAGLDIREADGVQQPLEIVEGAHERVLEG